MTEDFSQVNYDEYLPGTMDTADGNSTNVYFKRDPFTDEVIAYDSTGRKIESVEGFESKYHPSMPGSISVDRQSTGRYCQDNCSAYV